MTHFKPFNYEGDALCGALGVESTDDETAVTCRDCARDMERPPEDLQS